ncbi:unnamed protein product [Hydatigera taeniaeformis]|uniref:ENTH domain-containing protein n=1 Tax=Hydatigena taeniaeformis TaxID=6205 RepID=A0A158RF95_HYDTA|nr:unnamed protein product [Hydatigera taeniaeformis]
MPIRRRIKNSVGHYSRAELLVRGATSNDSSMPGPELLLEIADMTISPSLYADTVGMIWKRLNDKCKNWRHVYKALVVIEACLQYGSMRFAKECRAQLPQILTLCDFVYSYDQNSNAGFLIREKAQRVVALLKDENLLKQERQTARTSRPKDRDGNLDCRRRARSVYNPSDEYAVRTEIENCEQLRLAMNLSLQKPSDNTATKSAPDVKPTLLESSRKAGKKCEDLLCLDEEPPKSGRLNSWLESRFKRFSSLSVSDLCTPSSSSTDPAPPVADKWSVNSSKIPLLNASVESQKSSAFADLSGLDFGPLNIGGPVEQPPVDEFGGIFTSDKTLTPLSPTGLPIHKTSADEYFESLAKAAVPTARPVTQAASTVSACNNALVPEKPSTTTEKMGSKISSMLGNHRDLVDLDDICSIRKPPPPDAWNVFDIISKPPIGDTSFNWETRTSLSTVQQPVFSAVNQPAPSNFQQINGYKSTWATFTDPAPLANSFISPPNTNRVSVANTNPFL